MFFQSVFFMSQNQFTKVITRHQRTRNTLDKQLLKQLLWKDKNLLFAILYQGLIYAVFYGFMDIFSVYCATVLEIRNELFLSNIYTVAIFAVYLNQMFFLDVNFFDKIESTRSAQSKLITSLLFGSASFVLVFLLRFMSSLNSYLLLVITAVVFIIFNIISSQILNQSNYLIEQTALYCGEDSDHARNLAQLNASISKIICPFLLCLCGAFNFWQIHNPYLSKLQ